MALSGRLLKPIGDIPPADQEKRYYMQDEGSAMKAGLKLDSLLDGNPGVLTKRKIFLLTYE